MSPNSKKGKKGKGQQEAERYAGISARIQFIAVAMMLAFSLLCVRLWWLQVANMNLYAERSEAQQVRPKRLSADRGPIFARDNVLLADNRASTDVVFVPGDCPEAEREAVCARLESLIDVSAASLLELVDQHRSAPFTQLTVKHDISKTDLVRIEEHSYELPGVMTIVWPRRRYLHGETGGQILGFLGLDPNAMKEDKYYLPSDYVGKAGVELMYEDLLHGVDGSMLVTNYAYGRPQFRTDRSGMPSVAPRDSHGNVLDEIAGSRVDPRSGAPLHITLDVDLQAHCEDLLRGEVGAIVVLEAETGAVRALASSPSYDPNVFVDRVPGEVRSALFEDKARPMLHRGYQDNYAPGSVFKIMMAAAALEEGVINAGTTHYCPGSFRIGNSRPWYCWKRAGHGHVAVVDALAYSCDVFFYNIGLALGHDRILEWAHRFSLGEATGIDLPHENPALMPTEEWKQELLKELPIHDRNWFAGDTVNLSIGQGYALTTPLQNAVMTAVILNGGRRVRPFLNQAAEPVLSEPFLRESTLALLLEGTRKCVEKNTFPSGTGTAARIEGMAVVGKTGTAQVASLSARKPYTDRGDPIPRGLLHHAWFVAGVLDREPRIAVCVLIEHGDAGSEMAAPRAKDVIEFFYAREAARAPMLARGENAP
jgi:penicillin-binding protein 2